MFSINKEDLSISVTRGDSILFDVEATVGENELYTFQNGDKVIFKVYEKKNASNVIIKAETEVEEETQKVQISVSAEDMKAAVGVINKPTDYWYEVSLETTTDTVKGEEKSVQTIIGYDDNGAKIFRVYPEGAEEDGAEE